MLVNVSYYETKFHSSNQQQRFWRNILTPAKRELRGTLDIVDYTNVCCLFFDKNGKKLKNQQDIHSNEHFNLGIESSKTSHDP